MQPSRKRFIIDLSCAFCDLDHVFHVSEQFSASIGGTSAVVTARLKIGLQNQPTTRLPTLKRVGCCTDNQNRAAVNNAQTRATRRWVRPLPHIDALGSEPATEHTAVAGSLILSQPERSSNKVCYSSLRVTILMPIGLDHRELHRGGGPNSAKRVGPKGLRKFL
jgi:hypothetical protein